MRRLTDDNSGVTRRGLKNGSSSEKRAHESLFYVFFHMSCTNHLKRETRMYHSPFRTGLSGTTVLILILFTNKI